MLFMVALVVLFGPIEGACGLDFGDDVTASLLLSGLRLESSLLLMSVVREDGRAILGSNIGSLPVVSSGVVYLPEES